MTLTSIRRLSLTVLLLVTGPAAFAGQPVWRLSLHGVGPVRFGMSVEQAAAAAGGLDELYERDGDCYFVEPRRGPEGLSLMIVAGRVVRADVDSRHVRTLSHVGVGDSEEQVVDTYPGKIRITDHAYVAGHYLYFVPADAADQGFGLVFESDGSRVTGMRAGLLPQAHWVEGCS